MRVAIIGATGHIGTWLVPRLVRRGYDVVAVSRGNRNPYQNFPDASSATRILIDREQSERDGTFGDRIAGLQADIVVDLICFHVESAKVLVDALRGRVRHFIHCGTLWVHGNPPNRPYDETEPREPFGDYGIRKAEIERLLLDEAAKDFPATILHPGHITGPGWDPVNPAGHLDRAIFDRLARGELVELPDEGLATLQHVHADDVAQSFELAIDNPEESIGESFHVAAREPVTMRDYAQEVAGWYGREANLAFLPWNDWRKGKTDREVELTLDHMSHSPRASIKKAERLLGFAPRFSAVEAVRNALRA